MTWTVRRAAAVFFVLAFSYFFSALLRAVTATLAPVFSADLGLGAGDLGLLAGAYFLGFAALQLPLGRALDRHGPRRTLLALLSLAVLGCMAFALAQQMLTLTAARMLIGAGVAACLMAPLTLFRHHLGPAAQLRANSWMLMTGSMGMLASTLPVQWLLPSLGWRGLFWLLAALLALSMVLLALVLPRDARVRTNTQRPYPGGRIGPAETAEGTDEGAVEGAAVPQAEAAARTAPPISGRYRDIVRHPLFVRLAPLGFVLYGGMIAVQTLWAGPWLTQVTGASAEGAARGLFTINLAMLLAFMSWGAVMPRLVARGIDATVLVRFGVPLSLVLLALNVVMGPAAGAGHWAAWCVACTFVSVSQPAVGQAFPAALAGRALSAFNLVIFGGVFCMQWGIGLAIDALQQLGLAEAAAIRWAFALFGALCMAAYLWFLYPPRRVADRACP